MTNPQPTVTCYLEWMKYHFFIHGLYHIIRMCTSIRICESIVRTYVYCILFRYIYIHVSSPQENYILYANEHISYRA